ncbi:MAG: polyphosphate kinase 2 [Sphingomicrobium sp.]
MTVQEHAAFSTATKRGKNGKPDRTAGARKANGIAEPGQEKLSSKVYEDELRKLQIQLCYLQEWVKETGARVIIVCEGRDTAGKGGLIRRLVERVSPRVFRVVALSAPIDGGRKDLFLRRYVEHFPAAGEIVIFDRSWYNRAGVERVMGYTSEDKVEEFLANVPQFEQWLVEAGVILIKLWLEVGMKEQERRFEARIKDPLRQWKLSPMDVKSFSRWYDYSRARDAMFEATHRDFAPWYVLPSDDKKRARLNGIKHILSLIPYKKIKRPKIELPDRSNKNKYKDQLNFEHVEMVPDTY